MRIEVKQDHIAKAMRCHPDLCPIALAIREQLGLPVSVSFGAIWDSVSDEQLAILPMTARQFIRQFDQGLETGPFSFDLNAKAPRSR